MGKALKWLEIPATNTRSSVNVWDTVFATELRVGEELRHVLDQGQANGGKSLEPMTEVGEHGLGATFLVVRQIVPASTPTVRAS